MTCGLEGQKHMAVDNFPSLLCQSGVTPHLRSLWWCEPMAVANCLGGIRYAGQVSKRERGTLAWHRNERHANCFPVCHQATALWTIKSQSWEAFPVSLARSVSHPCLFLSQSLHIIHLSLLSLMESGFSSLNSICRFLSMLISSLAISVATWSELGSHWMTQSVSGDTGPSQIMRC